MQQWRDIGLAERLQHHRRFPEVQIAIFLRFWDLHRQMIRKFLALCIIHDPQGIYYGGTIAAPVVRSIFENILPYLES